VSDSDSNILIVAKNSEFRASMKEVLESADYTVLSRESIERTLQLLELSDIMVIVSGTEVAEGSCIDLIKTVREKDRFYSDTPIYVVGDEGNPQQCIEIFEVGGDEFSEQPFQGDIFLARLNKIIKTRQKIKSNPVTLSIRVEAKEVPGILQFLEAENKTGYLKATCDKDDAEFIFQDGKVVSAETEYCAGSDALTEVLAWPYCHIKFTEMKVDGKEFDLSLDVSHALMDCVFACSFNGTS